ncbi:MAG TPA: hypothetical protein VK982_06825 [Bacteroidales bacterium]|nr:hypothetical protein [Bacteroidales bacterium]
MELSYDELQELQAYISEQGKLIEDLNAALNRADIKIRMMEENYQEVKRIYNAATGIDNKPVLKRIK